MYIYVYICIYIYTHLDIYIYTPVYIKLEQIIIVMVGCNLLVFSIPHCYGVDTSKHVYLLLICLVVNIIMISTFCISYTLLIYKFIILQGNLISSICDCIGIICLSCKFTCGFFC